MKIDDDDRGIAEGREIINGWNGKQNGKDCDNDRWRVLCRMVAEERDPARMSALLDELITALDKRRQHFRQDGPGDSDLVPDADLMAEAEED